MGIWNVITDILQGVTILALVAWITLLARAVRSLPARAIVHEVSSYSSHDEPKPICGCTHHQCFHDENGCGHVWVSRVQFDVVGRALNDGDAITCGCKRYTGPEQLPTVIP